MMHGIMLFSMYMSICTWWQLISIEKEKEMIIYALLFWSQNFELKITHSLPYIIFNCPKSQIS